MNSIDITNFNYNYKENKIFENFSLSIPKNSYTTIIGPMASGKTTLFNAIINNHSSISINGDLRFIKTDPNTQICGKTVKEQLSFFLESEGYRKRQIQTRVNNIIKEFSLQDILLENPFSLSEGEKQLIVICSIIVLDLDILILDNALCRLDYQTKQKVLNYLLKLKKKKITIINFASDVKEILNADNVVMINRKLIFNKKLKEALEDEKSFHNNNLKLPFMSDLSIKLKYYDLLDNQVLDMNKMVDTLWN